MPITETLRKMKRRLAKSTAVCQDISDAARLQHALFKHRLRTREKRVQQFFETVYKEDMKAVLESGDWKSTVPSMCTWHLRCGVCHATLRKVDPEHIHAFTEQQPNEDHECKKVRPMSPLTLDSDIEDEIERRTGIAKPSKATMTDLYCDEIPATLPIEASKDESDDEVLEVIPGTQ